MLPISASKYRNDRRHFPTRRRFLSLLGLGVVMAENPWFSRAGEGKPSTPAIGAKANLVRHTRPVTAFGTQGSFIILHEDAGAAARALDLAQAELRQVDELLTLYRPDSALCRLNRAGVLEHPHPYIVKLLRKAQFLSEQTNGTFDVTIQPLWDLYAAAKKSGHLPQSEEIESARKKVDWQKLEITPDRIRLRDSGMAVTLNALAAGFAADQVLASLRNNGIRHALVNTGEIGALGHKEGGEPWTLGIQHPRKADAYVALARLTDCCLATSGDYATRFTDDFVHHHIFNPSTGRSPRELASVTVVASSALDADGLSTAIMVVGHERGLKLLQSFPGTEAFLVMKDGRTVMTPRFPNA